MALTNEKQFEYIFITILFVALLLFLFSGSPSFADSGKAKISKKKRRVVVVKQNPLMNSDLGTYRAAPTRSYRSGAKVIRSRVTAKDLSRVSRGEDIPLGRVKCDYSRLSIAASQTCRSKEKVFNSMSVEQKLYHNQRAHQYRVEEKLRYIQRQLSR